MDKSREELLAEADSLDAGARVNEEYMAGMERTTERTGGALGHLNNPTSYSAHSRAAAEKRARAAELRARAKMIGIPRERIEGYLSNKIQSLWPESLVLCVDDRSWIVRRPGQPDLGLGDNFSSAQQAVSAILRAERAKSK